MKCLPAPLRVQLHRFRDLLCLAPMLRPRWMKNVHVLRDTPDRPIRFLSDGLKIAGEIWPASGGVADPPAVILLHGCSIRGRRLALMQVLAGLLRQRGYTVMNFDARGFGDSQDPPGPDSAKGFDFAQDVSDGIDYLRDHHRVDPDRIYLLGHSFGASTALEAEQRDPRVAKVVLFGPPRRIMQRFSETNDAELRLIVARFRREMQLPYLPDPELMRRITINRDICRFVDRYAEPGHTPLMLIDAQHEDPRDLADLQAVHARMADSVRYWTVPDTDHYLNTGYFLGRALYHQPTLDNFLDHIEAFFNSTTPRHADQAATDTTPAA